MQRGHLWHYYPWPLVFYLDVIIYNMQLDEVTGTDFENLRYAFGQPWVQCIKPRPNAPNMSTQHIASLLGATCCVRLATLLRHIATCWVLFAQTWPFLNLSQQHPTRHNTSQHGGQRHAKCCVYQCCDMLCWHVAIVWPGLNNMYYLMSLFTGQLECAT